MIRRRRLRRDQHGDPVLTIEVTGHSDLYRVIDVLTRAQTDIARVGFSARAAQRRMLGARRYQELDDFMHGRRPGTRGRTGAGTALAHCAHINGRRVVDVQLPEPSESLSEAEIRAAKVGA